MSIGLAIFYVLINCPMIYFYEPFDTPFGKVCSVAKSNIKYHSIYFKGASVMYSFIPFVFIGIANVAIIYKFMNVKFIRGHGSTFSTNQALSRAGMKGTAILITVSLTFLFLTAPVSFYGAFMGTIRPTLLFSVLEASGNLNHAINSVLYCIVGTKFRHELMALLRCSKKGKQENRSAGSLKNAEEITSVTVIFPVQNGWKYSNIHIAYNANSLSSFEDCINHAPCSMGEYISGHQVCFALCTFFCLEL